MDKLSFAEARHLVSRTGIGVEWKSVKAIEGLPMSQAVDRLLKNRNSNPPPLHAMQEWRKLALLQKKMQRKRQLMHIVKNERKGLQAWYAKHLLATQAPLVERMTLFWHNVFPSTMTKVMSGALLYQQNIMLRKHAFGSFRDLLQNVAKDPAMLVYLDGNKNIKAEPNENFAREVLELFTVGRGQYGEKDIQEAARAFTGWAVNDSNGRFINNTNEHDSGAKTILGRSGPYNGEQALDIMLRHPRTAERIAERLWAEFISISRPDPRIIKQWASGFTHSHFNIEKLLKTILTSNEFWSATNRGALIKSPIDLVVGTLRTLPYTFPRNNLSHQLGLLGQPLFDQPSVKGWQGGQEWLSAQTLLIRGELLKNLSRGNLRSATSGMDHLLPKINREEMTEWLLAIKPLKPLPEKEGNQRLIRALVLDPAYQVL